MCLSIPGQIKSIAPDKYLIKYEIQEVEIQNSIIENLRVGDWVLVQNKFIVQQLSESQAQEFFQIIK